MLRARWLMVGTVGAIVGVFLTGPLGVLRLVDGDASRQADPAGTPVWARKAVGWIEKAFRLWS